jgi:hypothetical protein
MPSAFSHLRRCSRPNCPRRDGGALTAWSNSDWRTSAALLLGAVFSMNRLSSDKDRVSRICNCRYGIRSFDANEPYVHLCLQVYAGEGDLALPVRVCPGPIRPNVPVRTRSTRLSGFPQDFLLLSVPAGVFKLNVPARMSTRLSTRNMGRLCCSPVCILVGCTPEARVTRLSEPPPTLDSRLCCSPERIRLDAR